MKITLAESDVEIAAAFNAMRHLRDLQNSDEFIARVRQLSDDGYLLAVGIVDEKVVACAGFRIGEKLAWGRHLYVDDLVTVPSERSKGYGRVLLDWLRDYAGEHGCGQLHLDSGAERVETHRFYEREGLVPASLHFRCDIEEG